MARFNMDALAMMLQLDRSPRSAPEWYRLSAPDRADASEAVFIERQLLQVRAGLIEQPFPEFVCDDWIPAEPTRLDPGANHFTYGQIQHYGSVKLHTGMSERGPLAQVARTEMTPIAFVSKTNAYDYTVQDMRAASFGNFDLPGNKAYAARLAHVMERDTVMFMADGTDAYEGRYGLFKLASTLTYTVPAGANLDTEWETKTPDEILADMHGICDEIITNSNGVERPNMLGLPLSSYQYIARVRLGDGSDRTILEHFLTTRRLMTPGFRVEPHWRLDTAGSGSVKRMIAYSRNPMKVARLDSVLFEQGAPQVEGFRTITDCHSRNAGVYTPFPKSISYGDGI